MAKNHHDTAVLTKHAEHVSSLLVQLGDTSWVTDLIPIWRRPGWTTPAEFYLVELGLKEFARTAQNLLDMRQEFAKGVEMVGG